MRNETHIENRREEAEQFDVWLVSDSPNLSCVYQKYWKHFVWRVHRMTKNSTYSVCICGRMGKNNLPLIEGDCFDIIDGKYLTKYYKLAILLLLLYAASLWIINEHLTFCELQFFIRTKRQIIEHAILCVFFLFCEYVEVCLCVQKIKIKVIFIARFYAHNIY